MKIFTFPSAELLILVALVAATQAIQYGYEASDPLTKLQAEENRKIPAAASAEIREIGLLTQ